MSDAPGLEQWLAPAAAAGAEALGWLATRRAQARALVQALGVPGTKAEAWRYTSLTRLLAQGFLPAAAPPVAPGPAELAPLLIPGLDAHRVVLVNGHVMPGLSVLGDLPPGVRISGLAHLLATDPDAVKDRLDAIAGPNLPLFAALNTAGLTDGVVLLMGPGTLLARPLEVIHLTVGMDPPRVAQPRLILALEAGARAEVIERYLGLDDAPACTNAVVEIGLERGAVLDHQRVQLERPGAFHLAGVVASLGTASRYRCVTVAMGAAWARTDLVVRFAGEQAECDLQGLYLAGEGQLQDLHLDLDHRVPRCLSREHFKGILYGKGRAVFDGRVQVARDAQQTDAAMTNANLLLCEGAEVDTKPRLEIAADDVRCSHGTTVGQLDPEQLFYLRSRGISAEVARRMLCLGFAGEVLACLGCAPLREQVTAAVGRRLEQAT